MVAMCVDPRFRRRKQRVKLGGRGDTHTLKGLCNQQSALVNQTEP